MHVISLQWAEHIWLDEDGILIGKLLGKDPLTRKSNVEYNI